MIDFFSSIGSLIMQPLYYAVSGILIVWHEAFSLVLDPSSGWAWALSIVFLTVTIRALLIPLFVKQIKSQRNMQLLQPQIRELQKKYGHDRERMTQEQMKLWKETGTNPFASCLPLLLQMPIFFSLYRVLQQAAAEGRDGAKGFLNGDQAANLQDAMLLGGRIADTFLSASEVETRIITMVLVVIMCATQFLTQRQLMAKNMPKESLEGPFAQQQKILLYVLPFAFAFGGVFFPLGVLIYWTTTNFWTMGQQFYVIRNNPVPGTPAFKAKQERDVKKGKVVIEDPATATPPDKPAPQRNQQPKMTREQRRRAAARERETNQGGKKPGGQQSKDDGGRRPNPNGKKNGRNRS
ncbi:membrane protein insertase YidC [Aeromicrobium sp. CF4.19]|uniref:membrane protein insertase YidC n=1 Tax=Aeromicrobium sp. CF4.19 TaxID=3373082 RepID=UPI003EE524A6